jgi:hypothetical protein
MSRENRNFHLRLFIKGGALQRVSTSSQKYMSCLHSAFYILVDWLITHTHTSRSLIFSDSATTVTKSGIQPTSVSPLNYTLCMDMNCLPMIQVMTL